MKASGIFSWPASERRSDRYGLIGLWPHNHDGTESAEVRLDVDKLRALAGERVGIAARVMAIRKSGHIGDLFRGIVPSVPAVDEVIDLGAGTLVVGDCEGTPVFGLEPDDGRGTDWFDPRKLYRLHDQTVELDIQPSS